MIEIPILWQFVIILAAHYVGDFLLQSHWQATNKGKSNLALMEHVAVYTVTLALVTVIMFGMTGMWFVFIWMNMVLHFCTDYVTSRWSGARFKPAIDQTCRVLVFQQAYRREPDHYDLERLRLDPGKCWHNFFCVIGFDQLIHQATLAVTLWLIVA